MATDAPAAEAPELCPLCGAGGSLFYQQPKPPRRAYMQCSECALIWLQRRFRPQPADELARYQEHNNSPDQPGYRRFLGRILDELVPRLPPAAAGLDFGSGPQPVLSMLLAERGFPAVTNYDVFFCADAAAIGADRSYDFITTTEAAEHFFDPAAEFARLDGLLRPCDAPEAAAAAAAAPEPAELGSSVEVATPACRGWLGVMTQQVNTADPEQFGRWWYLRDPTHVCFYQPATMRWLARRFGWRVCFLKKDITLFLKLPAGPDRKRPRPAEREPGAAPASPAAQPDRSPKRSG